MESQQVSKAACAQKRVILRASFTPEANTVRFRMLPYIIANQHDAIITQSALNKTSKLSHCR